VMPPAGSPTPAAASIPTAPPPTQWVSSAPPAPVAAAPALAPPPSAASGDWVTVVPPAVATAALAAGTSGSEASVAAASSPPQAATGSTPAQPVSTGGLGAPASSVGAPHLWRVVGVQDGDTVTCLDESNQQQRIRLAGIDAPELSQAYGKESREALAAMVFGKTVEVYDQGRDENGRWIARVVVDGVDVDRQMVASGNAWHYTAVSSDQALETLQSQAQTQQLGLWSAATAPTPPWVYRQSAGGS
jgi:endonuclease YncB( thermonuclease family)